MEADELLDSNDYAGRDMLFKNLFLNLGASCCDHTQMCLFHSSPAEQVDSLCSHSYHIEGADLHNTITYFNFSFCAAAAIPSNEFALKQ